MTTFRLTSRFILFSFKLSDMSKDRKPRQLIKGTPLWYWSGTYHYNHSNILYVLIYNL